MLRVADGDLQTSGIIAGGYEHGNGRRHGDEVSLVGAVHYGPVEAFVKIESTSGD